ncbi:3680_t:CDS:2, partial [Dentiscutata heterogama]
MSKDGTFSMGKSQQAGRRIFKLVNKNKIKNICAGDMYKSHEFDGIPCFVLSNNLNNFQLYIKNTETKEWEAIFWFDKIEMFSVNYSSEIVGINCNKHLELYSKINDSIQKMIIDIETQEQQEKIKSGLFFITNINLVEWLIYSSDADKSGIVSELLSSELYIKPKKQKSGSNWWNEYNKYEIVLFDEWYTYIDWNDIVKYLNDTPEDVEQKHKGFIPFLAKYVFMTSHKPPEEAFNFRRNHVNNKSFTQRDWDQFYCRLDFIIKFTGKWNDIDQCTTELIFHKSSEKDFHNMNWDVKYCKGEFTVDELKTIVQGLNQEQDGEVIIKQNQVYWRRCFREFKKNYLCDYSRCCELSDYKQELLQQSQLVLSSTTS